MNRKPKKEIELSPYVISHWKKEGYCVHGEVSIFGRSTFIDHVAHKGPCHSPDYVIGIEMKKGAGKSLQKQLFKLDVKHVVDELWGVVISNPQEKTLEQWETAARWHKPGLMVWKQKTDSLEEVISAGTHRRYKKATKKGKLLLVPENKETIAGYVSGHEDNDYLTHFSYTKDAILNIIREKGPISPNNIREILPSCAEAYKRPKRAMKRMIRVLELDQKEIILCGRENKDKLYKIREEGDTHYDVDDRFENLFELED